MGVSINGDPQNGYFIMENPILKWMIDDLGAPPFSEVYNKLVLW